ncbi:MAG: FMN-binding negative transcriptional regulator [Pirellulales bacterium]
MYVPPHFAESDLSKLHTLIETESFGLLVSQVAAVPFATHLPFLLDRTNGLHGTLIGHMARANPHWRELETSTALVVFSGPHSYISPSWYEAENVVPTWNYTAVHAYGRVRMIHDKNALLKILQDSISLYEAPIFKPWTFDSDEVLVDRLLSQIVGFSIEIERIEGKFKLSQNHPVERREKVVRALRVQGGEDAEAIATMIQAGLHEEGGK